MAHFKEGFTFTWKIENFSKLPFRKNEILGSPIFIVETLNETRWCLYMYPKGIITNERDDYLSLYLSRTTLDTNIDSKISYAFTLESVDSAFEISMSEENVDFNIEPDTKGFDKFQELKIIYDNKNMYLPQDILTISCHIWPFQEKLEDFSVPTMKSTTLSNYFENRCSAKTSFDVQKRTLAWPIKKINELVESKEKVSIYFTNILQDSPAFKLSFYIDKNLNAKYAQIEILPNCTERPLFVNCKITIVNGDKVQHSHEDSHLFSLQDEIWHFPEFILIDKLMVGKYTYTDNTMFLQCKFTFSFIGNEYNKELPIFLPNVFQRKETSESKLNKNIQALYESKKLCDVELRVSEKAFPCHKLVICAQSPVFDAMFENNMKEKETGVVEIPDLDPQTLEKLLKFLYMEVIEDGLTIEEICKLYSAADRFEVLPLQQGCSLLLLSSLSVTSICSVLAIADTHQDPFLWTLAYDFLTMNSKEVFHSPQWKTFMIDYPTLSRETMVKICMEEPY